MTGARPVHDDDFGELEMEPDAGDYDYPYDDDLEDDDDDELGFTEDDCGRWVNSKLSDQCRLAGTEDCDWECPVRLPGRA